MKQSVFMRVLFCKIHCPSFICFCKPSAAHLYNPGPLKLENTQNVPSTVVSVADSSDQLSGEVVEVKGERGDGNQQAAEDAPPKSCIRKVSTELGQKKKVQWVDKLGKELAEIKEFESSDNGDTDNEQETRGCVCTIL